MQKLPTLRLPTFDHKIKTIDGKLCIWDIVRKKYISLTPEEWVRQHFINLLTQHLDFPRSLFKIESSIKYDKKLKRTDIQVLDRTGGVFLLVECKSPEINLNDKTIVQLSQYNKSLAAEYLAITNGNKHFVWKKDPEKEGYLIQDHFPKYHDF